MTSAPPAPPSTRRGLMLVLSSPSGTGKSTIARAVLDHDDAITLSISVTTRAPRPGEKDGVHYFFRSQADVAELAARHGLLEHAQVFDHHYGTPRAPVEAALTAGRDVLFDIDWQGMLQLRATAGADVVSVFLLPPSLGELRRRLHARGQDSEAVIDRRMAKAWDEISHASEYDFVVVNDDLERAIGDVRAILRSERLRRSRQPGLAAFVEALPRPGA